jgi:hypothetical protein
VFAYRQPDGTTRHEYRPPAEVGHADSLATLELAHTCDDHPPKRGEAKGKAVGAVGGPRFDGRLVIAKVMVRDDAVNAKVANGKCQLSCGYDCVLVETPGHTPEGERYDAIQTQIRYEHVAIVAAGRAGPEVRLRLDALEPEERDDAKFAIGDKVRVRKGKEHDPKHAGMTMTVAEIRGDTYAVKMHGGKVHRWYTGDEIEHAGAGRDDGAIRMMGGCAASCSITSTTKSAVELEDLVGKAIASIPGAYLERRGDRADSLAIQAHPWGAPSVHVSTRDLSLDDLTSQLAEALGPGVTVKRGDAATTPHEDTMDLAAQLAAALKDAADQKTRADALDVKVQEAEAKLADATTRASKAEGERDAAKDRADAAEKARQDAADSERTRIRARLQLEDKAQAVLGADFKADGLDDTAVRVKVLEKLTGKQVPAEKAGDASYIEARYDAAIEARAAGEQALGDLRQAGGTRADGGTAPMTEAQAMAEARRKSVERGQHPTPAR